MSSSRPPRLVYSRHGSPSLVAVALLWSGWKFWKILEDRSWWWWMDDRDPESSGCFTLLLGVGSCCEVCSLLLLPPVSFSHRSWSPFHSKQAMHAAAATLLKGAAYTSALLLFATHGNLQALTFLHSGSLLPSAARNGAATIKRHFSPFFRIAKNSTL